MSYATLTLVIGLAFKKVIPTLNRAVAQRPLVAAKGGSQFTRFFEGLIIQHAQVRYGKKPPPPDA